MTTPLADFASISWKWSQTGKRRILVPSVARSQSRPYAKYRPYLKPFLGQNVVSWGRKQRSSQNQRTQSLGGSLGSLRAELMRCHHFGELLRKLYLLFWGAASTQNANICCTWLPAASGVQDFDRGVVVPRFYTIWIARGPRSALNTFWMALGIKAGLADFCSFSSWFYDIGTIV